MSEDMLDLARRAVVCKAWRWMLALEWAAPGMSLTGGRPFRVDDGWHEVGVYAPDLTDPATLGCLLALVREAWNADWIYAVCDQMNDPEDGGYLARVCVPWASDIVAPTEAEALVAALEAAP